MPSSPTTPSTAPTPTDSIAPETAAVGPAAATTAEEVAGIAAELVEAPDMMGSLLILCLACQSSVRPQLPLVLLSRFLIQGIVPL